jgi:hypothetical protein
MRSFGCGYPYGMMAIKTSLMYDDTMCGGATGKNKDAFNEAQNAQDELFAMLWSGSLAGTVMIAGVETQIQGKEAVLKALDVTSNVCEPDNPPPTCAIILGAPALLCGALVATAIWLDVGDWLEWDELDANMYDANLKGTDYCADTG